MPRRRILIFTIFTAASFVAVSLLVLLQAWRFPRLDLAADDFVARHGQRHAVDPKLIFLAIDQDSMLDPEVDLPDFLSTMDGHAPEAEALRLMSAPWPWSRRVYGLVLDRLFAAGARAVALDLNFPTAGAGDADFQAALERHRGRVILGSNFVAHAARQGTFSHSYSPVAESLLPRARQAAEAGYVNFWADADDVVRSAVFTVRESDLNGHRGSTEEERFASLDAQMARALGQGSGVPTDGALHRLRLAPPGSFPRRPLYEIFAPELWQRHCGSGELFRDAVVVVGALGDWAHDEHLTMFGMMPGPEIHLNALAALREGGFVRTASPWETLGAIALLALAGGTLGGLIAAPVWRLPALLLLGAAWAAGALALYNHSSFQLPTASPLAALALNAAAGLLYDFAATRRDRHRVRSTLQRYVSRELARELIENPREFQQSLGGVERPVTVLFSDIRNFTRLCAQAEPQALVHQLNEYLTAMVACVFEHRGNLDKFVGDAVMAVWGNVRSRGAAEDARSAVRCALAMQAALARLNRHWIGEGRLPLEIGIALNHGPGVVGNIGSPHRMEFAVMGNVVNSCWRLQERTKLHAGGIILGEAMEPLLGLEFTMEPAGEVLVGETLRVGYGSLRQTETASPERLAVAPALN